LYNLSASVNLQYALRGKHVRNWWSYRTYRYNARLYQRTLYKLRLYQDLFITMHVNINVHLGYGLGKAAAL
jgi:hypothetical protein